MLSPHDKDKINDYLRKGKKIEAVKYLRDQYQLSLKDASDWIAFLSGDAPTPPTPTARQENQISNMSGDQKVKWLLQKGNYLEAIKQVRMERNLSLKEAKNYIDRFSKETGIRTNTASGINTGSLGILIFLFVGISFLLVSLYLGWRDYRFYQNSVKVNGKIISLQYASDSDPGSGAVPIVEYTWRGQKLQITGDTYSNPPAVEIGESIEVLISQQDSKQIKLNIISERYFLIFIFGVIGIVFFAIGFVGKYGWPKW